MNKNEAKARIAKDLIRIPSAAPRRGSDNPRPVNGTRRYQIQGDGSGHKYFVEVGMEAEFEQWLESETGYEDEKPYNGHDYEKNRIDGRFTFTDPRCE